ncbi:MAG: dihydroorotate dehydrogenase, partial [Spirochaeta sp.]|nr:dihydroorotate dehydrogenase [Spirochaeta sp.]
QTVFLWLPGVGEKPFSPAIGTPAVFLVRRRGPLTRALGELEPGETVFLRGPYGTVHHLPAETRGLLVGAGSGAAVLPALAAAIISRGGSVSTVVGVRAALARGAVELALAAAGPVRYVADEGVVGRVLEDLVSAAHEMAADRVYVVGPDPFMKAAVSLLAGRSDLTSDDLFISVEQPMRCGVGLCGECHVNGWLTCHSGTIVPALEVAEVTEVAG